MAPLRTQRIERDLPWLGVAGALVATAVVAAAMIVVLAPASAGPAGLDTGWFSLTGRDLLLVAIAAALPLLLFAYRNRQLAEARRHLRERESQLEAYSKAALDWFWETDEHHRITTFFGGSVGKKDVPPDRFVGKTRQELAVPGHVAAHADAWARHQATLDRREPFRNFEYRVESADGSLLTVSVSGAPVFDATGAFRGYRGTGTDVTALRQATEGSRTSEAQLWSIINNAPLIVLLKDRSGRYTRVNKMACEVFGACEADMLGKTSADFFPPDKQEIVLKNDAIVQKTLKPHEQEFELDTPAGTREFLSVKFPVLDQDGDIVGLGAIMMDISERSEHERALRESEARLRDFASSASDWFWETGPDLRLTDITGRFEQKDEAARRWSIGKNREDVASAEDRARNPERWAEHRATLERREPFRSFEFEIADPDGERRIVSSSGVPVFDDDGTFRGYRGGATDVTEYRKAEREAAAALEQLEFLANNVPALIAYVDRDYVFQFANRQAEAWYARPRSDIVGRHMREVFGVDGFALFEPYCEAVSAGREVSIERDLTYPDGKSRRVNIRWVPRMRDGVFDGFIGLVVDISEQHALQETLRQSQKMEALGQLTGGVAHDFNNLLLAIQGNLELLQDEVAATDTGRRFVSNSLRGVERAAELTRRLLAFSRRQPFMEERVGVAPLVDDLHEILSRILEESIDIRIETRDRDLFALTDRAQLENAVLNLAINARDAMPEGGALTIRTEAVALDSRAVAGRDQAGPGRYVRLCVADTGWGMTDETRRRATEPFFTTKETGAGTGLGLSMVHGFVEQSGGFIEIESEPGQGTTVALYLPLAESKPDTRDGGTEDENPSAPQEAAGRERILLVEDEPLVREVAALTLKGLGYAVTEASTGVEALGLLHNGEAFDLLLTDIVMPGGISGIDLVERARALQPKIKAIMATGHVATGERFAARRIPDVPVLRKPFTRDTLGCRVREVLTDASDDLPRIRAAAV